MAIFGESYTPCILCIIVFAAVLIMISLCGGGKGKPNSSEGYSKHANLFNFNSHFLKDVSGKDYLDVLFYPTIPKKGFDKMYRDLTPGVTFNASMY